MTSESFISHAGLLRAPRTQAADGALLSPLSQQTVKALADDLCCPPLWGALSPKLTIYELLILPLPAQGPWWILVRMRDPLGVGACWIGHLDRVHLRVQNLSIGDPLSESSSVSSYFTVAGSPLLHEEVMVQGRWPSALGSLGEGKEYSLAGQTVPGSFRAPARLLLFVPKFYFNQTV